MVRTFPNRAVGVSRMPDVGADLLVIEARGYFDGISDLPAERLMVVLELLRHQEITVQQAARLIGFTTEELIELLARLPVTAFRQIARSARL